MKSAYIHGMNFNNVAVEAGRLLIKGELERLISRQIFHQACCRSILMRGIYNLQFPIEAYVRKVQPIFCRTEVIWCYYIVYSVCYLFMPKFGWRDFSSNLLLMQYLQHQPIWNLSTFTWDMPCTIQSTERAVYKYGLIL